MSAQISLSSGPTAEALKGLSELKFLSQKDAEELLPYLENKEISSGTALWKEGEESAFVTIILSGRFEEKKAMTFANKQIVVGVFGKGSLIGESSLLDGLPRPLTAVCLEDARVLTLSRIRFETLQQEKPQVAMQIFKAATQSLSLRLAKSFERLSAIF